ncbi:MAG TPA: hypothetical protein VG458_02135 [Solirubrobacterales bacterium]|nr:hypothetical protein [Solirubrobacterales bacterium]
MVVMPRESWTDERLDDFRGEVNRRFDETNRRIDETNQRMEAGFAEMRQEFQRINDRLDSLNERLDSFHARLDGVQQMSTPIMGGFGIGLLGVIAVFMLQH